MSLAARLRAETDAEHHAIEAALDWQARCATPAAYTRWLLQLHGWHRMWEPLVEGALAEPALTTPRRRLALLVDDLRALGVCGTRIEANRVAPRLRLASANAAMGSLYVIEGSSLGGRVIGAEVKRRLGFAPRYHGVGSAARWREFTARLDRIDTADAIPVIASARWTFAAMQAWLTDEGEIGGPERHVPAP